MGKKCIIASMCQETYNGQVKEIIIRFSIFTAICVIPIIFSMAMLIPLLLLFLYGAFRFLIGFFVCKSRKNKVLGYINTLGENSISEINTEVSFSTYKFSSFYMLSYFIYDPNDNFLVKYEDIVSLTQVVYRRNYVYSGLGLKFNLSNGKSVTVHINDADDFQYRKEEFNIQLSKFKMQRLQMNMQEVQ